MTFPPPLWGVGHTITSRPRAAFDSIHQLSSRSDGPQRDGFVPDPGETLLMWSAVMTHAGDRRLSQCELRLMRDKRGTGFPPTLEPVEIPLPTRQE